MHILVLEASTTSAKAMLYNMVNAAIEVRTRAFCTESADASLHEAERDFLDMARLGRELADGKDVLAVALSCTWHSVMLCGRDMRPATPVYLWSNTEASGLCGEIRRDAGYTNAYYQKTGCMVNGIYPFFKLKMLANRGYNLSAYRIMGQGTYNTWRLTGEWVATDAVASGSGLMDVRAKAYDPELLRELKITDAQLGRLITYRDTLSLSDEGAAILGLRPGIPVVASMPDGALNQVGSGAMGSRVMTLSVGTSGAMRFANPLPVMPKTPGAWCYLGPDTWLSGAATSGCCNCVDWFISHVCGGEIGYEALEAEAEKAQAEKPEGKGLVFLPFLFGERCPGWNDERSGGFLYLKPAHTRGDMYRAVLEGVLFNLYQCFEIVSGVNGAPHRIMLSGGIANSLYWTQMCADVFQHEMEMDETVHASMLGSVALAGKALGLRQDVCPADGSRRRHIVPNPKTAESYHEKYARYLTCYKMTGC